MTALLAALSLLLAGFSPAATRKAAPPSAAKSAAVPSLPKAAAAPAGPKAASVAVSNAAADVAKAVEAAAKGGAEAAGASGAAVQAALENVKLPKLSSADTAKGLSSQYAALLPAVRAAAQKAALGEPMFTEAVREQSGWTFRFWAGGRQTSALIQGRVDEKGKPYAYAYGPYSAAGDRFTEKQFAQALKVTARQALALGRKKWGNKTLALSLVAQSKRRLVFEVSTEDGEVLAVRAHDGKTLVDDRFQRPTREEVVAQAKSVMPYKGRPWSQTEYNLNAALGQDALQRRHATEAQLQLYDRLLAEAPVRNGGFNPWSGD